MSTLVQTDTQEWLDCTGDVVAGDTIKFTESVFVGSHRNPEYVGERTIIAEVISESYGKAKQQHTFSLRVLASSGEKPLKAGTHTKRKGRNVYRKGTVRRAWRNETCRKSALRDKHERGRAAREARQDRKEGAYV